MSDARKTLYLVDGTSQLFRAFFALPPMSNAEGLPTNAVYGFTNMLRKLLAEQQPSYIAVAFDVPGPTFRNETWADYKANRPPTPPDLKRQLPWAKRVCEVLGTRVMEREGYEADDLIATHAERAREAGFDVVIVASDKDVLQLVRDGVSVFNPTKEVHLDADGVTASFGVPPERVLDVQGLMGDSVDNIPGVPGVGEKTALAIVATYGELERVIARAQRFVAASDARDALLERIDTILQADAVETGDAERFAAACGVLEGAAAELLEVEQEPALRERWEAVRAALAERDAEPTPGQPGKAAGKWLRPLKKTLRELDKGSSKKVWYAIAEHAEQARLSMVLATLDRHVPVDETLESLRLSGPQRRAAHELFRTLGFKSLLAEYEGDVPSAAVAARAPAAPSGHAVVVAPAELRVLAEALAGADRLALVTVVEGGDPMRAELIGLALADGRGTAAYVPIGHAYLGAPDQPSAAVVAKALAPVLADPDLPKIGHDLKSAAHVLRRHGMPVGGRFLDTMVAAFLLDTSRSSFALDRLVEVYLGESPRRLEDLTGSGAKRVPPAEIEISRVAEVVAGDATRIFRLGATLERELVDAGLESLYAEVDGPLLPLLVRMEAWGIRVDTDLLSRMSAEMEGTLERLRSEIHELAGTEFNVDSPKQLREVLFDRLGLVSRRRTAKSGVASTDAQTLEELAEEHEIARRLLAYRELAKLKGTYVDSLPRLVNPDTGRVHTCFHPTGAATGRLSSSDPNLQNIPVRTEAGRQIRSAFVADGGWCFLASDYSQIELRVLAHLSGDEELTAAFRAGEDIHRYTASRVAGVLPDLVTPEMRRRAKAVNFGILYGMAATRLAREQGMSRKDAQRFIDAYFERFASVRGYIERVRQEALRDGEVRTLFGRVRKFPQLHQRIHRGLQEQALRAAVNATIQGTAADLMKMAMLRVDEELAAAGLGARILLQVHDELLLEIPDDEVEQAAEIVRRAMEEVYRLEVPLKVDQKTGRSWMEVA